MSRPASRLLLLILSSAGAALLASCGSTVAAPVTGGSGGGTPPAITGHLAVADAGDNRILIYSAPLSTNESASIAIGQTGLTQGSPNQGNGSPSAATLYEPVGMAVDASGNLWVADNRNCRVLEFQPPFKNGINASLVIGEPDFETSESQGGPPCEASAPFAPVTMFSVGSVALDPHGDLWVADGAAGRVTEYVPPFSNGMAPSVAIGQTNLRNSQPCNGGEDGQNGPLLPPTSATLCGPTSIAFDSHGDLWVTDEGNLRILEFVPPFSTGMSASIEMVGQPPIAFQDNGTSCNYISASNFCNPNAITFDRNGNLWVADSAFFRVLEFIPPFSNGMNATLVIGQPSLNEAGPSNPSPLDPSGLSFDSIGNLIITNGDSNNSQILVYTPPFSSGMSPTTATGVVSCPPSGQPAANTLCDPVGVVSLP